MSALTDTTNTIVQETETVEKANIVDTVDVVDPVVENSAVAPDDTADEKPMKNTSEESSREEMLKKYEEHVVAGRRFMKTNVFDQATESFSQAAAMIAEIYGEGSEETFEANFLYGKALLELAKIEDEVLTNALTDIPKGDDDVQDDVVENPDDVPEEEREEIKQKVEEALSIETPEAIGITEEQKATTTDLKDEKVDESIENPDGEESKNEEKEASEAENATETTEDVEMETTKEQEAENPEADQPDDESEADEDEPVRLAWEILETCRCICEKKLKSLESEENTDAEAVKIWKLNHAEVLTSLGEHGMVDSKYEQAQKDLAEAVAIQAANLPATSRVLANTTHLLAKAFSLDSVFEKAATHFSDCKNILIAKAEELKKQLDTVGENEKHDVEAETKELEELIPELDVFINDARASADQTEQIKETVKKELAVAAENIAKLSGEVTKDITDMVRRPAKRPASEESVEELKKQKADEAAPIHPDEKATEPMGDSAPAPVAESD